MVGTTLQSDIAKHEICIVRIDVVSKVVKTVPVCWSSMLASILQFASTAHA